MTHDELLATLSMPLYAITTNSDGSTTAIEIPEWTRNALRAVVGLHRPADGAGVVLASYENGVRKEVKVPACIGCGYDGRTGNWEEEYPCPTIQAIEKELE